MKRPREADDYPDTNGLTILHRSRLVPWRVAAVTCIAACPDGSVFAAGYDDGAVEVFDANLFNCLARIPGTDGAEITSVAWAKAAGDPHWRLFASTLGGSLLELSCQQLKPIATTDSFGGAIWCLRPAPASKGGSSTGGVVIQLAAACGDGSIKLYSVHAHVPGAEYVRSLPRVEGNVLALAWHPDGHSLVSGGSDGCIHCWDVRQGTELQRITVGTSSNSPPCVWALTVLRDGTIVSGDGDGAVQFWDGSFGTLLSRQQQFAADVLTVVGSPDGKCVWASGVDPRVATFHLVPDKAAGGAPHWMYVDRKQPHTHDVRSLAVLERPDFHPLLISGGDDGQLVLYPLERFLKEHPTRQSKTPQRPLLQLSSGNNIPRLLHVQQHTINVWQLGRAVQQQQQLSGGPGRHHEGDQWDLGALPKQVATIVTSSGHHIVTAALAPDGSAVAAADRSRLRIFKLNTAPGLADDAEPEDAQQQQRQQHHLVQRVKVQGRVDGPVLSCAFSSDSNVLYAATAAASLLAVDVSSGEIIATQPLAESSVSNKSTKASIKAAGQQQQKDEPGQQQSQQAVDWVPATAAYMPRVTHLVVAPNGQLLAVSTASGVELYATPGLQRRAKLTLLGDPAPVTALAFSPNSKFLAVGTAANSVTAYSSETGMPTQWSLKNHEAVTDLLQQLPGSVLGLSFRPTPAEPLSLLVHSSGGLCHLDMSAQLSVAKPPEKVPRSKNNPAVPQADPFAERGRNGRLLKLQHCCLLMGHLTANEAVLVEKPWQDVLQQLKPPLHRRRYGT